METAKLCELERSFGPIDVFPVHAKMKTYFFGEESFQNICARRHASWPAVPGCAS